MIESYVLIRNRFLFVFLHDLLHRHVHPTLVFEFLHCATDQKRK